MTIELKRPVPRPIKQMASDVGSIAEARRLVLLANQRLRVLDSDGAADLRHAALDSLPDAIKARGRR